MKLEIGTQLTEPLSHTEIITRLLELRGVPKERNDIFLNPPKAHRIDIKETGIAKKELTRAFKRLARAYCNKESVVVYTDYDADGITGGSVMWQTLYTLGFQVMPHVPDRKKEGYGFSRVGIDEVIEKYHPSLIIAVDHGIAAEEHIAYLKTKNIDTIILDHHLKSKKEPTSAYALIYTTALCGAGVSYFFARALKEYFMKEDMGIEQNTYKKLQQFIEHDCAILAGIGTIADLMSLQGVSRSLAHYAINNLSTVRNFGLRALLAEAGIDDKTPHTSYDIGFIVAPRINAAGRLGAAIDALRLLCTTSSSRAHELAQLLGKRNSERQKKTRTQLQIAEELVADAHNEPILFAASDKFDEGIVGLLAARLSQKYYRPTLVAAISDGHLKGSARSVRGVHITNILNNCAQHLTSYGGHEQAGGFSLSLDKVSLFTEALRQAGQETIDAALLERSFSVDIALSLAHLSLPLVRAIQAMEPFGNGNEEPLFLTRAVTVLSHKSVGKKGDHIQLVLRDASSIQPIKAIWFFAKDTARDLDFDKPLSIVYTPTINSWRGEELSLIIKDIID